MSKGKSHPEPEFVVVCSVNQEWRMQTELIAQKGRPMLLVGPCDGDVEFLEELARKYGLAEQADRERGRYLFWKPAALLDE